MIPYKQYLLSILAELKGKRVTLRGLQEIKRETGGITTAVKKGRPIADQYIKALKRVAIVVPVWMMARMAIRAVTQTISEGIRYWIELESAIARAQAVTSGATMGMGRAMDMLRTKAEQFARTHAGTSKEVIEAYYRMGTSGLVFRDAILASIPAVTLAKGTYGDVAVTAKTVSAIYRLLGDNIKGVTGQQEKMTKIVDVLARAWTDHEIEMNELAQAIANVGGQAKAFGLTMTQVVATLAVSHDALIKGGRAGRLFGRTLDEMAQKLPKVEKELGIAFDPKAVLDWFGIFKQLVDHFHALGRTTPEIEKAMGGIFNIRSKRIMRSMVALGERFNETLKDLTENSKGTAEALLEIRDNTPEVQIENLRENISMLVKDFIMGVTETDDFVEGLKKMNRQLERMSLNATLSGIAISGLMQNIRALWRMMMALTEVPEPEAEAGIIGIFKNIGGLIKEQWEDIKSIGRPEEFGARDIFRDMENAMDKWVKRQVDSYETLKKERDKLAQTIKKQVTEEYEIKAETLTRLKATQNLVKYREMELRGYDALHMSVQKLRDYVENVTKELDAGGLEINKQQLLTAILTKNWKEVLKITQAHVITEKELANVAKMVNQIQLNSYKIRETKGKLLIEHELELLRIVGISNAELIKAQRTLEEALYGRIGESRELEIQLQLEREITKEKLLQIGYSNETIQLYRIAQKFGISRAIEVARTLREGFEGFKKAEWGFGGLSRILKQYFPKKWETFEMRQFFAGKGREIPIREKMTREDIVSAMQFKLERITPIKTIPVKVEATVHVKADELQIKRAVRREVLATLKSQAGKKEVKYIIEEF